jgi:hypothetical protein
VLPMAIELGTSEKGLPEPVLVVGQRMAKHARRQVALLSDNRDRPVREAISSVLDIVETLERQVELLHRRMVLEFRKLKLEPTRVSIGGDGVEFVPDEPLSVGDSIRLHILIPLRGGRNLLSVDGFVTTVGADNLASVTFASDEPETLDLLVGFTFEHQRRERRREAETTSVS